MTTPFDDLSEIYNEGNYRWWSLDSHFLDDSNRMKNWSEIISRVRYASSRLLGCEIKAKENLEPNHDDVYNSNYALLSHFGGEYKPSGKNHEEMSRLKPGDKMLAVILDDYNVVVPCEIIGPITEDFMKEKIESNPAAPGDYEEIKDNLSDWTWDCIIVRPLVRLKNTFQEMPETITVQRIYCFSYKGRK